MPNIVPSGPPAMSMSQPLTSLQQQRPHQPHAPQMSQLQRPPQPPLPFHVTQQQKLHQPPSHTQPPLLQQQVQGNGNVPAALTPLVAGVGGGRVRGSIEGAQIRVWVSHTLCCCNTWRLLHDTVITFSCAAIGELQF